MAGCLSQEVEVWCGRLCPWLARSPLGWAVEFDHPLAQEIGRLGQPGSTTGMRGRLGNSNKYLAAGKRDKAVGEARSLWIGTTAKVSRCKGV